MVKPYSHYWKKIYADDIDRREDTLELLIYGLGLIAGLVWLLLIGGLLALK